MPSYHQLKNHFFASLPSIIFGFPKLPILNTDASFTEQAIGTATIFAFVFGSSYAIWFALKNTIGIRIGREEELGGQDMWETGGKAYPEFMLGAYPEFMLGQEKDQK